MKYIIIIGILIAGGLLFVNKDRVFSDRSDNQALVNSVVNNNPTSLPKCGQGGSYINQQGVCYCPERKSVISWYSNCSLNATTTKMYTLNVTLQVAPNGGTVSPIGKSKHAIDSSVTITATPNKGYRVLWPSDCQNKGQKTCKLKMDSDKTILARWELKKGWRCTPVSREQFVDLVMNDNSLTPQQKEKKIRDTTVTGNFSWCGFWRF